ncbi:MAG: peptidyl-alpha-hydroxyglycine alpha-amidating lyase family protein [Gemmatimonadota bacterium]
MRFSVFSAAMSGAAVALVLLAAPPQAFGQGAQMGAGEVAPINNLPNPYETVRNWGTLPGGRSWGSVSGIHVDIDGVHIWAADRCGTNSCAGSAVDPIVKLDGAGNVVTSFGAGLLIWPHGMHVDREGNVWIVDARAANAGELERFPDAAGLGHRVVKFSPTGEVLLTLGTGGSPGEPPTGFFEPNDVITAPNGDIFVSEAHNAQFISDPAQAGAVGRISKFSADGTFIRSWGTFGFEPGQFRGPHALAMDSQGRLFVSDRGNNRIQIFDQEGNLLDVWMQFSRISGLSIDANDVLYAVDSESDPNYNPGWRKGVRVGSAATGEVWYFIPEHVSDRPSGMGGFGAMGEGITADAEGNLYVGEVGPIQGITKFIPRLVP